MSQSTFVSTTNASTLTYNQSLPGSLPATQAMVFRNGVTNIDVTYAFHVYSSTDGTNWTRLASKVNVPQTFSAPYIAVASDDDQAGTGTITGSAATGESFVTGSTFPAASGSVGAVDITANAVSVSSSSGRWLVTKNNYSAPLKLNKFVLAPDSSQQLASLFTVMDAYGAITDLSVDDPGYITMVDNPPYTTTFPSVFPSGFTPDIELPPGTKYQVEVKATNILGNDTEFSNDVMPVAGVLQTSVINAQTKQTWVGAGSRAAYSSVNSDTYTQDDENFVRTFDGKTNSFWSIARNVGTHSGTVTFTPPLTVNTKMRMFVANSFSEGGDNYEVKWSYNNGTTDSALQTVGSTSNPPGDNAYVDVATSGIVSSITIQTTNQNPSWGVGHAYLMELDGSVLINGSTTVTTEDNTNYDLFTVNDAVVENSGGTPVTSAITNVAITNYSVTPSAASVIVNGDDSQLLQSYSTANNYSYFGYSHSYRRRC